MKRALSIVLIALVAGSVSCKKESKQEGGQRRQALEIEVFVIKSGVLDNVIKTTGNILPAEMVELKTEIAGRIEKLNIQEGKRVSEGTVLVQIDDSELQAQLRKLQAELKLAEENEKRQRELLSINGISKVEYDDAFTKLETTKADIDLTNSKIRKSKIIAPFNGTIGLRNVSPGAYVSVGTTISQLVQLDPLKIEFYVPEKYASFIKEGMPVQFTIVGSEKPYTARVYAYQSQITKDSRALAVRAILPNPNGELIPGAFADLQLELEKIDKATMVPSYCIVPMLNGQNLYVIKNGQVTIVPIQTGIRTSEQTQIIAGAADGDTVAASGLLAIKDKMPVKVKKVINSQ
ncbi:MAG: efflux RND transporter periplasmic adaptor subunit [Bacteroidales bacterium]